MVDPAVVEAWITGWALARGTPPPVADGGAFRVDVGWPQQKARYVFPEAGKSVRRFAESICEPWVYLKVCAAPDEVQPLLPSRWSVPPLSYMMTGPPDAPCAQTGAPADYRMEDNDGAVPGVRILAPNGEVAASGHVAIVGPFAIYDQIETHSDHRRRGLGRIVMARLAAIARQQGGTKGLLVATADGRALYETLGWRVYSLYTTAVIWVD